MKNGKQNFCDSSLHNYETLLTRNRIMSLNIGLGASNKFIVHRFGTSTIS